MDHDLEQLAELGLEQRPESDLVAFAVVLRAFELDDEPGVDRVLPGVRQLELVLPFPGVEVRRPRTLALVLGVELGEPVRLRAVAEAERRRAALVGVVRVVAPGLEVDFALAVFDGWRVDIVRRARRARRNARYARRSAAATANRKPSTCKAGDSVNGCGAWQSTPSTPNGACAWQSTDAPNSAPPVPLALSGQIAI